MTAHRRYTNNNNPILSCTVQNRSVTAESYPAAIGVVWAFAGTSEAQTTTGPQVAAREVA